MRTQPSKRLLQASVPTVFASALAAYLSFGQAVIPPSALAEVARTPPGRRNRRPGAEASRSAWAPRNCPSPTRCGSTPKNARCMVDGYVSLREGYLEMFACIVGTKEHESVVAVKTKAQTVHAALLAVGAKQGTPVQWVPSSKPATGTEIDVEVHWLDDKGKWKKAKAQDWIRDIETKKPMTQPWVFAGSGFWKDHETGKEFYMAESGDFICVSNFTTAMLDVPIESSQSNEG